MKSTMLVFCQLTILLCRSQQSMYHCGALCKEIFRSGEKIKCKLNLHIKPVVDGEFLAFKHIKASGH